MSKDIPRRLQISWLAPKERQHNQQKQKFKSFWVTKCCASDEELHKGLTKASECT